MTDPMGLLLAAARVDPVLMEAARRVDATLTVARKHHRVRSSILRYSCYYGECDHEDECPLVDIDCCAYCLGLAEAINDEIVPDECLAESCAVLLANEAMRADAGGVALRVLFTVTVIAVSVLVTVACT